MRDIKFRAWDDRLQGYTPYPIAVSNDGVMKYLEAVNQWIDTSYTPEQYTGLKDKNGKEIYEGDILHTDEAGWIAKVIWHYDGFMLTGVDNKGFSCSPNYVDCTIIGNIHENPELLA